MCIRDSAYTSGVLSVNAGDGLVISGDNVAVAVANTGATGLTVEADAIRLTSSSNPGAAAAVLATDANGSLLLDTNLLYVDAPNNRIGVNRTPAATLDVVATANADHTARHAEERPNRKAMAHGRCVRQ